MNDRKAIEKILPKEKDTEYDCPDSGYPCKNEERGYNSCRKDSASTLSKRVATVEEIAKALAGQYASPLGYRSKAQALQSKYIILRREEK